MTLRVDDEQRLSEIMNVLLAMSSLDFARRAPVGGDGDLVDALASGINMLGEELCQRTISNDYFRAVLDSMGEALLVIAPDLRVRTVNAATCRLLGMSERALIGQWAPAICEDGSTGIFGPGLFEALLEAGGIRNHETSLLAADENPIPVHLNAEVMRDEVGRFTAVVCIARDLRETSKLMADLAEERTALQRVNAELADVNQHLATSLEELRAAQRLLVQASRQAGMAEVATGVLHNVGNVLNSLNVSASIVLGRVQTSKVTSLEKVVRMLPLEQDELARFLTEDTRGRQIPEYLRKLSEHLEKDRRDMLAELQDLSRHLEHVKSIVSRQQAYATSAAIVEKIPIEEVIAEAMSLQSTSFSRHGITVTSDIERLPPLLLDRHKLLELLANLLANSRQALERVDVPDKRIDVRAVRNDAGALQIDITDNGVGIAPDDQKRIFAYGFTTKPGGHGFGLASCLLAARGMGGSVRAFSEGRDRGATFTIELPLRTEDGIQAPEEGTR